MANYNLSQDVKDDIKNVGISIFKDWLEEKKIDLPAKKNLFLGIEKGLQNGTLSKDQIINGLCELEENSDKKIHFYQAKKYTYLKQHKAEALKKLKVTKGWDPVPNYSVKVKSRETATFNYLSWDEEILKIKFSEKHYDVDPDYESGQFSFIPKIVYIIIMIDTADGLTQIRFDNPGKLHKHKNDRNKSSESAFEKYYENILWELFEDIQYASLNFVVLTNKILNDEEIPFRIHRGVNTLGDGGKQVYALPHDRDIRENREFKAASEFAEDWLTDELSGFWKHEQSEGSLNKDLFMRISRRASEIRIQRGCLEKELNYGIAKIKEILQGI
jgi:hypothetical protein